MNSQAIKLNQCFGSKNPAVFHMLSTRGKAMYFPYKGILGQGAAAKGKAINATVGLAKEDDGSPMRLSFFDDLPVPPGEMLPYAPSPGQPGLRKKWQELIYQKNPSLEGKDISVPVVTQALTHGLSVAASLFLDPGDEILVPDPYWDNYSLLFHESFGANISTFPCFEGSHFNTEGLKQALKERSGQKIVLLFNSPNNPTGYTPTREEMRVIAEELTASARAGSRIVLLIDDAYFGLVYKEGVERESLFSLMADAHENILSVKIDGVTKEDYAWGLRIGFITYGIKGGDEELYKALADKTAGVIRGTISNCSQLSQSLILKALSHPGYEACKQEKFATLKKRFDVLTSELQKHPEYEQYFRALPYNSGYFMCLEVRDGIDAEKVRNRLLDSYDTGVIVFGALIRLAFSCVAQAKIPTLLSNVCKACEDVKN